MANMVNLIEYVMFVLIYALCFYYLKTSNNIIQVSGVSSFVHVIFTIYVCINLYGSDIDNILKYVLLFAILISLGLQVVSFIILNLSFGNLENKYKKQGRKVVFSKSLFNQFTTFVHLTMAVIIIVFLLLFVYYMNNDNYTTMFYLPYIKNIIIGLLCLGVLSVSCINVYMSNDIMKTIEKVNVNAS